LNVLKAVILVAIFAFVSSTPTSLMAAQVNLPRYLATYSRPTGSSNLSSDTFFGTAGTARLIVANGDDSNPGSRVTSAIIMNPDETLIELVGNITPAP